MMSEKGHRFDWRPRHLLSNSGLFNPSYLNNICKIYDNNFFSDIYLKTWPFFFFYLFTPGQVIIKTF